MEARRCPNLRPPIVPLSNMEQVNRAEKVGTQLGRVYQFFIHLNAYNKRMRVAGSSQQTRRRRSRRTRRSPLRNHTSKRGRRRSRHARQRSRRYRSCRIIQSDNTTNSLFFTSEVDEPYFTVGDVVQGKIGQAGETLEYIITEQANDRKYTVQRHMNPHPDSNANSETRRLLGKLHNFKNCNG